MSFQRLLSAAFVLALIVTGAWSTHALHNRLLQQDLDQSVAQTSLLSAPVLKRLALGQSAALADLYYLRAINHFGDKKQHGVHYPLVQPLLWRASMLDENFLAPYLLSGQIASILGHDLACAMSVLERGRKARPDTWQIAFFEGFIAYYFLHEDDKALKALRFAASFKDAPLQVASLVVTLAKHTNAPEVALNLLETLLSQSIESDRQKSLLHKRNLILLEVYLQRLQEAQKSFEEREGRKLRSLDELVSAHLVGKIPSDPLGGDFYLDNENQISTSHQTERLDLRENARGISLD